MTLPIIQYSVEELVQALRRSSLPTILVEGRDDMTIYRWLEIYGNKGHNILPCGGRSQLFEVFNRRTEFSHIPSVFIADRDMYLFSKIPSAYNEVIFTKGYSIENDLLDGSLVYKLLSRTEKKEFCDLSEALSIWFAFEVEQFRRGEVFKLTYALNALVPIGRIQLSLSALSPRTFRKPNARLINSIKNNFHLKYRGKNLVELYIRILNSPSRIPTWGRANIIEMSAKCDSTKHTKRISSLVNRKIK